MVPVESLLATGNVSRAYPYSGHASVCPIRLQGVRVPTIQLFMNADGSASDLSFDDVTPDLIERASLIWIDLDLSERTGLERCADLFSLHDLAVESALIDDERAQITVYDDMLFLEFYGMRSIDGPAHVELNQISIFVGEAFVITVRGDGHPEIEHICDRWRHGNRMVKHPSASLLLYTLLDELVDDYFPVVDAFGEHVEDLEDRMMNERAEEPLRDIQVLRKQLFTFRRAIGPQREVLNTLVRRDVPLIDPDIVVYIADVQDHLLRVLDWLDAYRDLMTTLFEVQLGLQSQRLNLVVRKLTASSIMLMVASLIAGIYGMNFDHMPELHWMFGYPLALLMMLASTSALFLFFRKRQWF